VCVYT